MGGEVRREHTEANKLLDIAETGDRQAYKAALEALRKAETAAFYEQVAYLARWQFQMYQRYHRLFAWRAEWTKQRGK